MASWKGIFAFTYNRKSAFLASLCIRSYVFPHYFSPSAKLSPFDFFLTLQKWSPDHTYFHTCISQYCEEVKSSNFFHFICTPYYTEKETSETEHSFHQKYSNVGVAHVVSIVRGPLAASMNALIVRCPSFFPSSFAYSAHLVDAVLLYLCTSLPLYPIVPPCPPPSCRRPGVVLCGGLVRPGLGLNLNGVRRKPVFIPRHGGLRSKKGTPKSMGTAAAYNGQSTKDPNFPSTKELGRQWQNGGQSDKDLVFPRKILTKKHYIIKEQ